MMDAWMKSWTDFSETKVTPLSLMTDTVPSLTDGTPPIWLSSVSAPMIVSATMMNTAGATWLGLWMSAASAPMAAYGSLVGEAPAKPKARPVAKKAAAPKAAVKAAPKKAVAPKSASPKPAATKAVAAKPAATKAAAPKTAAPAAPKAAPKKAAVAKSAAKTAPKSSAKPAAKKAEAEKPAPAAAAPAPKLDDRPAGLAAPRAGKADDLKKISGVGPKLETVLNDLGIYHFDQIAAWKQAEIDWVDDYLRFKGRIQRDGWIKQAKAFAKEAA